MPKPWTCVVCGRVINFLSDVHFWDMDEEEMPHCGPPGSQCCDAAVTAKARMRDLADLVIDDA